MRYSIEPLWILVVVTPAAATAAAPADGILIVSSCADLKNAIVGAVSLSNAQQEQPFGRQLVLQLEPLDIVARASGSPSSPFLCDETIEVSKGQSVKISGSGYAYDGGPRTTLQMSNGRDLPLVKNRGKLHLHNVDIFMHVGPNGAQAGGVRNSGDLEITDCTFHLDRGGSGVAQKHEHVIYSDTDESDEKRTREISIRRSTFHGVSLSNGSSRSSSSSTPDENDHQAAIHVVGRTHVKIEDSMFVSIVDADAADAAARGDDDDGDGRTSSPHPLSEDSRAAGAGGEDEGKDDGSGSSGGGLLQERERQGAPLEIPVAWRRGRVYTGPEALLSANGNHFLFLRKSLAAGAADKELYSAAGVIAHVAHSGGSGGDDDNDHNSISSGSRNLSASLLIPGGASSTALPPSHLRGGASSVRRRTSNSEGIERYRHRHRLPPPPKQTFDVTAFSLEAADDSSAATPGPSQPVSSSSWSSSSAAPSSAPSSAPSPAASSEPNYIFYSMDAMAISIAVGSSTVLLLIILALLCHIMGQSRKRRVAKKIEEHLGSATDSKQEPQSTAFPLDSPIPKGQEPAGDKTMMSGSRKPPNPQGQETKEGDVERGENRDEAGMLRKITNAKVFTMKPSGGHSNGQSNAAAAATTAATARDAKGSRAAAPTGPGSKPSDLRGGPNGNPQKSKGGSGDQSNTARSSNALSKYSLPSFEECKSYSPAEAAAAVAAAAAAAAAATLAAVQEAGENPNPAQQRAADRDDDEWLVSDSSCSSLSLSDSGEEDTMPNRSIHTFYQQESSEYNDGSIHSPNSCKDSSKPSDGNDFSFMKVNPLQQLQLKGKQGGSGGNGNGGVGEAASETPPWEGPAFFAGGASGWPLKREKRGNDAPLAGVSTQRPTLTTEQQNDRNGRDPGAAVRSEHSLQPGPHREQEQQHQQQQQQQVSMENAGLKHVTARMRVEARIQARRRYQAPVLDAITPLSSMGSFSSYCSPVSSSNASSPSSCDSYGLGEGGFYDDLDGRRRAISRASRVGAAKADSACGSRLSSPCRRLTPPSSAANPEPVPTADTLAEAAPQQGQASGDSSGVSQHHQLDEKEKQAQLGELLSKLVKGGGVDFSSPSAASDMDAGETPVESKFTTKTKGGGSGRQTAGTITESNGEVHLLNLLGKLPDASLPGSAQAPGNGRRETDKGNSLQGKQLSEFYGGGNSSGSSGGGGGFGMSWALPEVLKRGLVKRPPTSQPTNDGGYGDSSDSDESPLFGGSFWVDKNSSTLK